MLHVYEDVFEPFGTGGKRGFSTHSSTSMPSSFAMFCASSAPSSFPRAGNGDFLPDAISACASSCLDDLCENLCGHVWEKAETRHHDRQKCNLIPCRKQRSTGVARASLKNAQQRPANRLISMKRIDLSASNGSATTYRREYNVEQEGVFTPCL